MRIGQGGRAKPSGLRHVGLKVRNRNPLTWSNSMRFAQLLLAGVAGIAALKVITAILLPLIGLLVGLVGLLVKVLVVAAIVAVVVSLLRRKRSVSEAI